MLLLLLSCTDTPSRPLPGADSSVPDTGDSGESPDTCPEGITCIASLPFTDSADTRDASAREFDAYACSPDTNESGPEFIYRVDLATMGFLSAALIEDAAGTDVDVHILSDLDPDSCLDRGNSDAAVDASGVVYIVVDTYVSGGEEKAGPFTLTVDQLIPSSGDCSMESGWMDRINDNGDTLEMPATGPVVLEAHLVTEDDGYGTSATDPWPATSTEGLDDHHDRTRALTGLVMSRTQSWAPREGCEYGQSACGYKLPVEDEAWYVNMYWADRPDAGTRMILMTDTGRAVIAAAGYETGPGDLSHIGGTTEEAHRYLGTGHLSTLTIGFAIDQTLPLGPITCQ